MGEYADLATAYTHCTCVLGLCTTKCQVCYSPQWENRDCVKLLWRNTVASDNETHVKPTLGKFFGIPKEGAPLVAAVPPLTREERIEAWIDKMEDELTLLPWQAHAFRAIMLNDSAILPNGERVTIPTGTCTCKAKFIGRKPICPVHDRW